MNAKTRLLASIGGLVIGIICILSYVNYQSIHRSSTVSYQRNLTETTHLVTAAIEERVGSYFQSLNATAAALRDRNGQVEIDGHTIEMMSTVKAELGVSNYFVALPDGMLFDTDSQGRHPSFNARELQREWFVKGMQGIERVVTVPFKASTGKMSISLAVPVIRQDKVVAVVGLNLLMDDLTSFINTLSTENNVFVAREDGFLMAAFDPQLVGVNLFDIRPSFADYSDSLTSKHTFHQDDVGDIYVISQKSEPLNWTVWAFTSWASINEASTNAIRNNVGFGSLFVLIGIVGISILIQRLMYDPIGGEPKDIEKLVDALASGELADFPSLDEHSKGIYRSTLAMAENLRETVTDIDNSTTRLTDVSVELDNSSYQVKEASSEQMTQIELIATAMNEMAVTVSEVAQYASGASHSANTATQSAQDGRDLVEQMNVEIALLVENIRAVQGDITNVQNETENVGSILDVIRGIADQTNLLALNAAIEAARAGEHGRGFAVVADEVRSLANKTQHSTNEIQLMIEELQAKATQSVISMNENALNASRTLQKAVQVTQSLGSIQQEIQTVEEMNHQIAAAAEEQSHVAQEINANVIAVNELARRSLNDVENNGDLASELSDLAKKLRGRMHHFTLS